MMAYDNSDKALDRELTEEEIESVLASQRAFFKDPAKMLHFVQRAKHTVRINQRKLSDLRTSIEVIQDRQKETGHPMQRILDALKELSDEDKQRVLQIHVREQLAKAEKEAADAQRARAGAISEANKVRFMLGKLADSGNLPQAAREEIERMLSSLPNHKVEETQPKLETRNNFNLPNNYRPNN